MLETSSTESTFANDSTPSTDVIDPVFRLCLEAQELEDIGEFEAAVRRLDVVWDGPGTYPRTTGLRAEVRAEVLLRSGTLTGWVGDAKQVKDYQERAKDLIGEGREAYNGLRNQSKVAESEIELGYCYWRTGEYDEARVLLNEALRKLAPEEHALRAVALLRQAMVESSANRNQTALELMSEARPHFVASKSPSLMGKFHFNLAVFLRRTAAAEGRDDLIDRSLIEAAAASHFFEEAGHRVYRSSVECNLGYLFYTRGRYLEAHEHLATARLLFDELKDTLHAAQTDDTRARVFLAQGDLPNAEKFARAAVAALRRGDSNALLAEALTTLACVLARSGRYDDALASLGEASATAEIVGAKREAINACLTLIEELGDVLPAHHLRSAYDRAERLLAEAEPSDDPSRLGNCARMVITALRREEDAPGRRTSAGIRLPPTPFEEFEWKNFSLKEQSHIYERPFIERALKDSGGSVLKASRLLGYPHHNSLVSILNSRHKDLVKERSPVIHRRRRGIRSIIKRQAGG